LSRYLKSLLWVAGGWIFFSFGFRLYILLIRWETTSDRLTPLVSATIFIVIGLSFIRMARLADRATSSHYRVLCLTAGFIILFWAYRLVPLLFYPHTDPNPRSHIHLSAGFLVLGLLLLYGGIKGPLTAKKGE
jgi:hypothetical protein